MGGKVTLKELVFFLWNETILRAVGLYYLERGWNYLNVMDMGTLRVISPLQKHSRPYSLLKWDGLWLIFRYCQHLLAWFWAGHEDLTEDVTVAESSCESDRNTCRAWEQQRQPCIHSVSREMPSAQESSSKDGRQQPQLAAGSILNEAKKSLPV